MEELAEEEQRYFDLFSELQPHPDIEDQVPQKVSVTRSAGCGGSA